MTDDEPEPSEPDSPPEPISAFQHPQWMVGVVAIFGMAALYAGLFGNPIWLLIGSPFIAVLVLILWLRLFR